jgi:drug/metabolite transporter (DMT)-like permease
MNNILNFQELFADYITNPIVNTASAHVIFLFLYFVFHEPLTRQQKWGIVEALAGIVLMGLSG